MNYPLGDAFAVKRRQVVNQGVVLRANPKETSVSHTKGRAGGGKDTWLNFSRDFYERTTREVPRGYAVRFFLALLRHGLRLNFHFSRVMCAQSRDAAKLRGDA